MSHPDRVTKDAVEWAELTPTEQAALFIDALHDSRRSGFAIVPLIGAGLSAPSGIPIVTELQTYLVRCICRALGIDLPAAANNGDPGKSYLKLHRHRRWLPGRDDWPPFGDPQIYDRDVVDWSQRLLEFFHQVRDAISQAPSEARQFREVRVIQEALGASAEWRSALLYLSRLRVRGIDQTEHVKAVNGESESPGTNGGVESDCSPHELILGPPNRDIVDTFVLNVLTPGRPTLGHRMLAALAGPLRISLALTTNFDDLMEQAFTETNNLFTVFDVHIDSGLPPHRDMLGKNAIVKLHGGRFGMRADYSLDTPPSESDLRNFVSYLADEAISDSRWDELRIVSRRHEGSNASKSPARLESRRHLLVVGVGARDQRINQMIATASRVLKGLRVYWISYNRRDLVESEKDGEIVSLLENRFDLRRFSRPVVAGPEADDGQNTYCVLQTRFPGLLFLQAFQQITGSIPPAYAIFPSAHRLPVSPEWGLKLRDTILGKDQSKRSGNAVGLPAAGQAGVDEEDETRKKTDELMKEVERLLTGRVTSGADGKDRDEHARCLVIHGEPDVITRGVSMAAGVFEELLEQGHQAVWIDLDEVGSVNDLFEATIHTVARKAGIVDWMPVLLHNNPLDPPALLSAQVHELARITNNPNRKWVIFLNGRSGPGANLRLGEPDEKAQPTGNGWLDRPRFSPAATQNVQPTELPGASAASEPHVTEPPLPKDGSENGEDFAVLLREVCCKDCPNVIVVLLCYSGRLVSEFLAREVPSLVIWKLKRDKRRQGFEHDVNRALWWVVQDDVDERVDPRPLLPPKREIGIKLLGYRDVPARAGGAMPPLNEGKLGFKPCKQAVARERCRFLLALCLANRTRYLAMLWQRVFHLEEGNERSPQPLAKRIDRTSKYLNDLQKRWVIRRKTGGFVWLYCRVRDSLRDELSAWLSPEEVANVHQGLAEWYHLLFRASQDPVAVFEIIYHRCQQILALLKPSGGRAVAVATGAGGLARSKAETHYSEIIDALGAIELWLVRGRESMLAFGFSKGLCRRLEHLRESLLLGIFNEASNLDKARKDAGILVHRDLGTIKAMVRRLARLSFRANREIAIEVGENRTGFVRYREERETVHGFWPRQRGVESSEGPGVGRWQGFVSASETDPGESLAEWIESVSEHCALGIATRSCAWARSAPDKVTNEIAKLRFRATQAPMRQGGSDKLTKAEAKLEKKKREFAKKLQTDDMEVATWALEYANRPVWQDGQQTPLESRHPNDTFHALCDAWLGMLKRHQQALLAEAHIRATYAARVARKSQLSKPDYQSNRSPWNPQGLDEGGIDVAGTPWPGDARSLVRSADEAFRFTKKLRQHVLGRNSSARAQTPPGEIYDRTWHRLTVRAAASAAVTNDFQEAFRLLGDAEAMLNLLGVSVDSLDRGVIDLYRAEVLTQQAVRLSESSRGKTTGTGSPSTLTQLGTFRDDVIDRLYSVRDMYELMKRRTEAPRIVPIQPDMSIQASLSHIEDAWQSVQRAERCLSRFRKNVWWTTWLFETQLKLIELELFCALARKKQGHSEEESELPYIGNEAAAYAVPTLIERILDNAVRMVRLDVYRLARIIESSANCLYVALRWRRLSLKESEDTDERPSHSRRDLLDDRLVLLSEKIRTAADDLKRRLKRRIRADYNVKALRSGEKSTLQQREALLRYAIPSEGSDSDWGRHLNIPWSKTHLDPQVLSFVTFVIDHVDRVVMAVTHNNAGLVTPSESAQTDEKVVAWKPTV